MKRLVLGRIGTILSFEPTYRRAVAATALLSLTSLAISGEMVLPVIILAYILIVAGFWRERAPFSPRPLFWGVLNLIVFSACGLAAAHFNDLTQPLVYFVVYVIINKCWTRAGHRDTTWLFAICFFAVVFATLFTTNIALLFVIGGFVVSFTVALMLHACMHEIDLARRAGATLSGGKFTRGEARLSAGFMARCLLIAASLITCAAVAFPFLPRSSQSFLLGSRGPRYASFLTGFSDDVQLGSFSSIQFDTTIVMRVLPLDATSKAHFSQNGIRLRALPLNNFDAKRNRWRRSYQPGGEQRRTDRVDFAEPPFAGPRMQARIMLEPNLWNYLFLPVRGTQTRLPSELLLHIDRDLNTVRLQQAMTELLTYETTSVIEPDAQTFLTMEQERTGPDPSWEMIPTGDDFNELREEFRQQYARVPAVFLEDPRFQNLVDSFRAGGRQGFQLARAVEQYLHTNYNYSTDLSGEMDDTPIHTFLFDTRTGHCELFASAMVMILRALGLSARMVNGYVTNEWNPISGHFIVRQENAHSWVEMWMPGYGWKTMDPTPPAYANPTAIKRFWLLQRLMDYYEAMRFRWYYYVVDYGIREQSGFFGRLQGVWADLKEKWEPMIASTVLALRLITLNQILRVSAVAVLILVVLEMFVLRDRSRRRSMIEAFHSHLYDAPAWVLEAMRQYDGWLKRLARHGFVKAPTQTPEEFACEVANRDNRLAEFPKMTDLYYQTRYGEIAWSADDRKAVRRFAETLRTYSRDGGADA